MTHPPGHQTRHPLLILAEEREARRDFRRATFSCWLGTAMEYADFALYGLAAGIIFGDVFFPEVTDRKSVV